MKFIPIACERLCLSAAFFVLGGCGPVDVKNCQILTSDIGGVIFDADVFNRTSRTIAKADINITITAPGGAVGAAEYAVGPSLPNAWTHGRYLKFSTTDPASRSPLNAKPQQISQCFVQAITYSDGELDILFNPL